MIRRGDLVITGDHYYGIVLDDAGVVQLSNGICASYPPSELKSLPLRAGDVIPPAANFAEILFPLARLTQGVVSERGYGQLLVEIRKAFGERGVVLSDRTVDSLIRAVGVIKTREA